MADTVVLKTEKRERRGSKDAERLRHKGKVPAIVYGHKEENEAVILEHDDLMSAIRHGARVVDLQTTRGTEKALIRDLQWDHLGKDVLHVDFYRVSADERIEVTVPIELRGIAPGVLAGGVMEQPLHSLQVECLAVSIPASIRVNIADLQLDGSIYVRDLVLPPGVKVLDDPDALVVHVAKPMEEAPAAPAAEAAATAEPEVIGRKAAEEEEEGK